MAVQGHARGSWEAAVRNFMEHKDHDRLAEQLKQICNNSGGGGSGMCHRPILLLDINPNKIYLSLSLSLSRSLSQ